MQLSRPEVRIFLPQQSTRTTARVFSCPAYLHRRHEFGTKQPCRSKDPDRRREYQREWVRRNTEKHRQQARGGMARWRLNRPDARLVRDRAHRLRHPDQQNSGNGFGTTRRFEGQRISCGARGKSASVDGSLLPNGSRSWRGTSPNVRTAAHAYR
jgi:hypothetical protein